MAHSCTDIDKTKDTTGMTERPTLKTISKMTGLAIATVSRALHDAPDISTQTKERVRACAEQIGYQPNRAGVRLRTGRTHVVAMMLATEADITSHSSQLVAAVAAKMHDSGYFLNIAPSGPKEDTLRAVQQVVQSRAADAIILNRTEADDPRVAYLMERRFPFVTHGARSGPMITPGSISTTAALPKSACRHSRNVAAKRS